MRIVLPQWAPRTERLTKFWQFSPRYGWVHRPSVSGEFTAFGTTSLVQINSAGFRGPDIPHERDSERKRILFLGDSMVWGYGVAFEDLFTRILEREIPKLQTINLAVSGYSTDQELLLYDDIGSLYQADMVVLVVYGNDYYDNTVTSMFRLYSKPAFVLEGDRLQPVNQPVEPIPWLQRSIVSLSMRSYILTGVYRLARQPNSGVLNRTVSGAAANLPPFPSTLGEKLTMGLILQLQELVARKQPEAAFLVVFADRPGHNSELASEYLARKRVDTLSLSRFFAGEDASLRLSDGKHWSPAGHRLVARVLADRLRESPVCQRFGSCPPTGVAPDPLPSL